MSKVKFVALTLAILTLLLGAVALAANSGDKPIATPFDGNNAALVTTAAGMRANSTALGSPGDLVNLSQSTIKAGNYLKKMQADVTEDNAGNGPNGSETPEDPDDGGWDWYVTSPPAPFFHTTAASPLNLYGVTALGLYYAYLKTNDATYFTAMQDAANRIIADTLVRTSSDMQFLMLFNDLPGVTGTAYKDAAKAKYDARIVVYGTADSLAKYIRNARAGYHNGIIGWDIGGYVVAAQMLFDRFGGTYAADADAMAEVLWQDSYNNTPGLFDVEDDDGFDPTYVNKDYWWYTLGLSGLLDAFRASNTHTAEIPDLVARLQASQFTTGAISGSYGANAGDEDWQSTGYVIRSLHEYDAATYAIEIARGAYWAAVTQDVSGGWLYSDNSHYPEVAAEATYAVTLGTTPSVVWVDNDWTSQADVDVYNTANSTSLVWGYDAFAVIADGVVGVEPSGTVNVLAGTYNEVNITISKAISVIGDPSTCGPGPNAPVLQGTASGITERGFIITPGTDNVLIDGFVIQNYGGIPNQGGGSCGIFAWGTSADPITNVTVQNCEFNHIRWAGIFFFNEGHSIFDNIQVNCNTVNMDDGMADNANSYGIECTNCKNSVISNNTVGGGWTGILMTAQAIRSTPTSVTVENNTISGNTVTGSVAWTGNIGIVSIRDRITNTALIQNITVSGNQIANSVDAGYGAFGIRAYTSGGGTFAGTMKVSNNSFTGNATKSLDNLTGILWDASGNYWGSNDTAVVRAAVSGNVDHTPWMQNAGTILNPGFSGDFSSLSVDDNSPQFGTVGIVQEAVNMVSGSTINLMPGLYVGQIVVDGFADLNIIGSGIATTTIQAPITTMTHSFATTGNNNFAVLSIENSASVDVSLLTIDGAGKGNINYRFIGAGYRNAGGSMTDVSVNDIRNTPFSGAQHGVAVYSLCDNGTARALNLTRVSTPGFQKTAVVLAGANLTANVDQCVVTGAGPTTVTAQNGVQFSGPTTGSVTGCTISGISYTPSTYVATGLLLYGPAAIAADNNIISQVQAGAYYIDNGGSFNNNSYTATTAGTGVTDYFALYVYKSSLGKSMRRQPQPMDAELIESAKKAGSDATTLAPQAVTIPINDNILTGDGGTNSLGIAAYTDGTADIVLSASGNRITKFNYGIAVQATGTTSLTTILNSNDVLFNGVGFDNVAGIADVTQNVFVNTINANDDTPGNTYGQNCWSDYNGTPPYAIGGGGGNSDANPNVDCGLDMTPNSIAYNCAGNFTFDVAIGSAITALDAANIRIVYPAELTVANVTGASGNYFLAYSQTSLGAGQMDTLKVNLGVMTGVQDGPATLFTVTMNGTTSVCNANELRMIYADLRDSTNTQIPAPLASPTTFNSDCNDPTIVVNSPATGGLYNIVPVLSLTATDDCDLNAVYYQIDGCTGAWLPIATGLTGTTYDNAAWPVPGFLSLPDGSHCISFKVTDDFGRENAATKCTYTWCFTKDVTPPAPPTNLVATPGHNKVNLTWANASADYNHTVVMRTDWYAGGHGYPEYDDNNAEGPYPISLLTGDQVYTGTGSTQLDVLDLSNATRDVYHYAAFTVDNAGNVSAASTGARSTSYWLGDIAAAYDGYVNFNDLLLFSNTYGSTYPAPLFNPEADFGPTSNMSPKGIPTTDNKVEFEDLAIFAINYDAVVPAFAKDHPVLPDVPIQSRTGLRIVERQITDGYRVDLYLDNPSNNAKALVGALSFDVSRLQYASATMSPALSGSALPIFFKPLLDEGTVSISAAVLGNGLTFTGSGLVATVDFRVKAGGKTRVALSHVDIRDNENKRLVPFGTPIPDANSLAETDVVSTYSVMQNQPNPFNPETRISYGLPTTSRVTLRVYNVVGELVKTLVDDVQVAGQHEVVWNSTNENDEKVASGIYFYRFTTPDYQKTVKMILLK